MVEGNNEIEGNEIEGPVVEGKVIEGNLLEGIALPRLARELWRRRGRSICCDMREGLARSALLLVAFVLSWNSIDPKVLKKLTFYFPVLELGQCGKIKM